MVDHLTTNFDIIQFVREGGGYCAVLELFAILFLLRDRVRLISTVDKKDIELKELSALIIAVATELKTFLFSERKS
jgi:hypothetical protein